MAQTIKLKRTSTRGKAPSTSNLELGELAINTYDGRVFIKKNDGSDEIVEIGGSALYSQSYFIDATEFSAPTTVTNQPVNQWEIGEFFSHYHTTYVAGAVGAGLHVTLLLQNEFDTPYIKFHVYAGNNGQIFADLISERDSEQGKNLWLTSDSGTTAGWSSTANNYTGTVRKAKLYVNSGAVSARCPSIIIDVLPGTRLALDETIASPETNVFNIDTDFTKTTRANSSGDANLRYRIFDQYDRLDGRRTWYRNGIAVASIDSGGNLKMKGNVTAYGTP